MRKIDCKPFLKWAGGKRQLVQILAKNAPKQYGWYYEPFIGGGALLFYLQPKKAYISDINPILINVYKIIRDDVEALIKDLKKHKNTEKYYYSIRNADRTSNYRKWSKVKKASRLIYLNKTCFNGLYRVNSKGHFNVPYGYYKNPNIVDEENLRNCSKFLRTVKIVFGSFLDIEKKVVSGDFVYFDPPYAPLSKTSSFTKYSKEDFNEDMQFALRELCDSLAKKQVRFMLSNSYTPLVKDLYRKKYNFKVVKANRAISCKGNKRGKVKEAIITNY